MQRIVLLIVMLAVAGGVYLLISQSDDGPNTPAMNDGEEKGPPSKKTGDAGLKSTAIDPEESLVPEERTLRTPARALLVALHPESWNTFLVDSMRRLQDLSYVTWYLESVKDSEITGAVAGQARGLDALKNKPTGEYLEKEDIRALIWDAADPNALPPSFWAVVAERVNSGRMGLYVRPGYPAAPAGSTKTPTQHPILGHPELKELLPIARASLIQGSPVPGLFTMDNPLKVSPEGSQHVATRLVKSTEASLKTWKQAGVGDGALGTRFCYPVQETKAGAQVLVNVEAATAVPAIIVSGGTTTRVLWMGNTDFGQRAYFVQPKEAVMRYLVNDWLIWLVGQGDE